MCPSITINVYKGMGHVDGWIELVLADAVAGHWTDATCRNVWILIQRYGACRNVTAVRS